MYLMYPKMSPERLKQEVYFEIDLKKKIPYLIKGAKNVKNYLNKRSKAA